MDVEQSKSGNSVETRCLLPLTTTAATTAVATTSVPAALACALALSFWLSAAEGIMLGEVLYAEKGRVDHRLLLFLAMLACLRVLSFQKLNEFV